MSLVIKSKPQQTNLLGLKVKLLASAERQQGSEPGYWVMYWLTIGWVMSKVPCSM